jgi:hypothetical protein
MKVVNLRISAQLAWDTCFQHFCQILGPLPLLYGPLKWRGGGAGTLFTPNWGH